MWIEACLGQASLGIGSARSDGLVQQCTVYHALLEGKVDSKRNRSKVTLPCDYKGGGRMAINVSSLLVLALGGSLVLSGRLGIGAMLSVNVYNTFLAVGLAQLAGSLGDIGNALASLQRYEAVIIHTASL